MPEETEKSVPISKKPHGGLYAKIRMSVRTANILVIVMVLLLCAAFVFVVRHNGFTVQFDTDGGSRVESVRVLYAEKLAVPEAPVKEGYVFTGWYTDPTCKTPWNMETDTVIGSMTLYAGWEEKQP